MYNNQPNHYPNNNNTPPGAPNQHSGMSTGQKVAIGGVAAVAIAGVATAVGIGGYKFYQSHQGSEQDKSPMKLYVHVHNARNLQAADRGGTSDPYTTLSQGHIKIKTKSIPKTLDPVWNERLEMGVYERDLQMGQLKIEVYDKDTFGDDSIGHVVMPLSQIPHNTPKEFNLNLIGGQKKKPNNGVLKISLHFGRGPTGAPGHDSRGYPEQGGYPNQGQPGGYGNGMPQQGAPYGSGYPNQGGMPGGYPNQGPPGGYGSGMPQQGAPYGSGFPNQSMGGMPGGYPNQGPPGGYGSGMPQQGVPYGSGYPNQGGMPGGYPPNPYN